MASLELGKNDFILVIDGDQTTNQQEAVQLIHKWQMLFNKKNCFCFFTDYNNIGKFLNRILGMEVHQQNALFQYFSDTLTAVIQNAKKNGRYDMGILGNELATNPRNATKQNPIV